MDINQCLMKFINNPKSKYEVETFIETHFEGSLSGWIRDDILLCFMTKSPKAILKNILPLALLYCDEMSVTPEVFSYILQHFRGREQINLFISLAHCKISVYQLEYIAAKRICLEAFASLLDIYLSNDCYTVYDVQHLVNNNLNFLFGIDFNFVFSNPKLDMKKIKCLQDIIDEYDLGKK